MLRPEHVPDPRASALHLIRFGSTFNGYTEYPTFDQLSDFERTARERYERDRTLPPSLTELRTCLFAAARRAHQGGEPGPAELAFVRAVVAAVAERVPWRPTPVEVAISRVERAFHRLMLDYAYEGGHHYYGRPKADDPRSYVGPLVWSEADAAFRFGVELEREFPRQVHLEFGLSSSTLADYDPKLDKRQFVDIVVSDLSGFWEDEDSNRRFSTHLHTAFIEVKRFVKGMWDWDAAKMVPNIIGDIERLWRHVERGHCEIAVMLIVDDEDRFAAANVEWPRPVRRLVVSPATVAEHRLVPPQADTPDDRWDASHDQWA